MLPIDCAENTTPAFFASAIEALDQRARGRFDLLLEIRLSRTSFSVARPAATATGLPESVPAW